MNHNSSESSGEICNTRTQISPSKHWCFTYNSYIENELSDFFDLCSKCSKKFVFQEETGENGNKHLQGYICFNTKVRPKGIFEQFYRGIHWEKTRSIKASILYCSDPSKRTGRIFSKGGLVPEPLHTLSRDQLYPWQSEVHTICTSQIEKKIKDDRTIYWFWEPNGNVGKSSFVKFLCIKLNALVLSGKGSDMKYGIVKYNEKTGYYPTLVVLDIPRTIQDYVSYSAIEEIKNGCFFSGKYEGTMCLYNSPIVLCFANKPPSLEKFSRDRWYIRRIVNKELVMTRL